MPCTPAESTSTAAGQGPFWFRVVDGRTEPLFHAVPQTGALLTVALAEELATEDVSRTNELAESDLDAIRTVADWIKTFVARPHKDLGRAGPLCPFVPGALERNTLWLAAEHIADRNVPDVVELVSEYQRLFLAVQPTDGDDAIYKSIVVVFTDLSVDRVREFFDDVLHDLVAPSYAENGFVMGGFYEGNEGTAIYNSRFRPFTSPVPFLLIRQAVISD